MAFSSLNVLTNQGYKKLNLAEQFLFSSLQGLANRTENGIYCICNNFNGLNFSPLAAEFWLGQINIPKTPFNNAWPLLRSYPSINSYILCDIFNDPESANIASSLAGIAGAITVDVSLEQKIKKLKYIKAADVRGWSFERLLADYGRTFNTSFAIELNNGFAGTTPPGIAWGPRDFAIANKTIVLFGQDQRDIVMGRIPECMPIYGWNVPKDGNEGDTITDVSQYGDYYVAADAAFNISVFNKLNVTPNPVPDPSALPAKNAKSSNTKYVAFMMSDGDNLQWLLNRGNCPNWWGSSYRGQIPIGWTMAPALFYQAPSVWNYYVSTMTPQDEFICGPSGIGYVFQNIAGNEKFSSFMDMTANFMRASNITSVATFGYDVPPGSPYPDSKYLQPYLNESAINGVFYSSFTPWVVPYNHEPYVFDGKAVVPTIIDLSKGVHAALDTISSGRQNPPVYLIYVDAWCNQNEPWDWVNGVVQGLPTDGSVQVVKPSELFPQAVAE